ncbi:MAG: HAD family hydrolase [Methanobrevibacter sp.]|nr:HAD family hydrolase [Methanobrevibacter sp.]
MKELYIFDLDGTLLDSLSFTITLFNKLLRDLNLPTYDKDESEYDYIEFRKHLFEYLDFNDDVHVKRFLEIYHEEMFETSTPFDGVIEVLEELQNQGKSLAICTNRTELDLMIRIDGFFKGIDFKYVSGYRKGVPDKPDAYRINEIIEKENISRDKAIFFGDKDNDILAARNAGIDIAFAKWGQGKDEDFNNPYVCKLLESPYDILDI